MSCFLLLVSCLLFFPRSLFAWGPIAHLDYASAMLENVAAFTPAVKLLLTRFPFDYLYGTLAADITLGKAYVDYIHNCHNWRVGFLILNDAEDDRQRACAYGYLSHLAVDIISHNYFVPFKTIRSYPTRTLGHVYWEMRFDALRPKPVWDLAKKISTMSFPHDDVLFRRMLKKTLFSFKTNKQIFNSVLTLHRFEHWKTMMNKLSDISRWKFGVEDADDYRQLALDSVSRFLKDPEKAPCTLVDPTGADKLLYAKELRHDLKDLVRRRIISEPEASRFLTKVKKALRDTIYHPGAELPSVTELI